VEGKGLINLARKAQPQQTMQRVLFSFSLRCFSDLIDLIPGRHIYIYHSSSESFMKLASSFFHDSPSLCSFLPWMKPSGPSASHRLDHRLISSNLFLPLRKDRHYENKNHGAFIGSSSFFQASRPRIFLVLALCQTLMIPPRIPTIFPSRCCNYREGKHLSANIPLHDQGPSIHHLYS
jgi:hypothetical protein